MGSKEGIKQKGEKGEEHPMCPSAVRKEGSFLLSEPFHPRRKRCIKPPPHHRSINQSTSIQPHPPIPSSSINSQHHTPFFHLSHFPPRTPQEQQEHHEPKQEDEQEKQDQDQHGDQEKEVQGLGDLKLRNSYSTSTPVLTSSSSASTVFQ